MALSIRRRPGETLAIRLGDEILYVTIDNPRRGPGAVLRVEGSHEFKITRLEVYDKHNDELLAQINKLEDSLTNSLQS